MTPLRFKGLTCAFLLKALASNMRTNRTRQLKKQRRDPDAGGQVAMSGRAPSDGGLGSETRLLWLRVVVAVGLFCCICLSWRLWLSSRLFPLSPVSTSLPPIPYPLDCAWLLALLGLLAAIVATSRPRRLILVFFALAGALSLWDQARWQPWFYQYLLMLGAIGCLAAQRASGLAVQPALNACRLIVAFTYLWSGLQKLNVTFLMETWPDMAGPFLGLLPEGLRRISFSWAIVIPVLEIVAGIGLLSRRYRNPAVLLAIGTHVCVLILLVASGENTVVWPWNVAMALFVYFLFWRECEVRPRDVLVPRNAFHLLVVLLFAILPAMSLVDLWDSYLSAALYSGNTRQAVIVMQPEAVDRLPALVRPYVWRRTSPFFLDINRWAYGELNVPLYPERRVYERVARQVCSWTGGVDVKLLIRDRPRPLSGRRASTVYDCSHLGRD